MQSLLQGSPVHFLRKHGWGSLGFFMNPSCLHSTCSVGTLSDSDHIADLIQAMSFNIINGTQLHPSSGWTEFRSRWSGARPSLALLRMSEERASWHRQRPWYVCVCVYYCSTYYKAVRGEALACLAPTAKSCAWSTALYVGSIYWRIQGPSLWRNAEISPKPSCSYDRLRIRITHLPLWALLCS